MFNMVHVLLSLVVNVFILCIRREGWREVGEEEEIGMEE